MKQIVTKYLILLLLVFGFSQISKGQRFSPHGDSFVLELEKEDSDKLQFVENTFIKVINNTSYSTIFYAGDYKNSGFAIPLTHKESQKYTSLYKKDTLTSYLFDINWLPNYRSFSITGFSKNYNVSMKEYYGTRKHILPRIKLPLSNYNQFLKEDEIHLIHQTIKTNIGKKIDSNYVNLNNSSIKVKHHLDIESKDIFPQTSLKLIEYIIKQSLYEGTIKGYKNDSLKHNLSKYELDRKYLKQAETHEQFDEYGRIMTGFADTVWFGLYPTSISLSEIISFQSVSDSTVIKNYLEKNFFKYDPPSELLVATFTYNAVGISYLHNKNEPLRTIWLDYNEVKEILIKEQVNFNLYEALFTKNLFDIFEIDNYFWQKEDYQKTKQ
ncbi:MAG: hypothetical protein COB15_10060 [Flavobacteriales bacterium]|nr:MAG: hypothetical protein COB15_10060 [Flavobacteriales bacterium]